MYLLQEPRHTGPLEESRGSFNGSSRDEGNELKEDVKFIVWDRATRLACLLFNFNEILRKKLHLLSRSLSSIKVLFH